MKYNTVWEKCRGCQKAACLSFGGERKQCPASGQLLLLNRGLSESQKQLVLEKRWLEKNQRHYES